MLCGEQTRLELQSSRFNHEETTPALQAGMRMLCCQTPMGRACPRGEAPGGPPT